MSIPEAKFSVPRDQNVSDMLRLRNVHRCQKVLVCTYISNIKDCSRNWTVLLSMSIAEVNSFYLITFSDIQ